MTEELEVVSIPETHKNLISSEDVIDYILAGNCVITIKSKTSGRRFTYKISSPRGVKPEDADIWFVNVLTGPDNTSSYTYLGQIKEKNGVLEFWKGQKSKIGDDAPSHIAWSFVWNWFRAKKDHPKLEVWHEGRCVRCGRRLTDDESIKRGMGSECAGLTRRRKFK